MFDSGTSCHMTGNSSMLEVTESILPISIGLPDGTNIASHQGSVSLGGKLRLNNGLYVPSRQCNLISMAVLCKDIRWLVIFLMILVCYRTAL